MLESSVLCLAFLLFAKEENWKQLQHLWVGEKLNKVVSGIQGRLRLRQLDGVCGNEEKMSEMYQVRKAGTGPAHTCGRREESARHTPWGSGARHVRKGLVAGRGGF